MDIPIHPSGGPDTRAYVERGTDERLSMREKIAFLKRYVARELFPDQLREGLA